MLDDDPTQPILGAIYEFTWRVAGHHQILTGVLVRYRDGYATLRSRDSQFSIPGRDLGRLVAAK